MSGIIVFCLYVALSCFFVPSQNQSTFALDTGLLHGTRGPGEWFPLKMVDRGGGGGSIILWKSQATSSTVIPSNSQISILLGMPLSPVGLFLNAQAPKWAVLTLKLCTQHCARVSHLHVPHQNSTSTWFSTAYEVMLCSTQLLTARTVSEQCLPCSNACWMAEGPWVKIEGPSLKIRGPAAREDPRKISVNFIHCKPLKIQNFRLSNVAPSPDGCLLSAEAWTWAVPMPNLFTQYCVQVSDLHILH